MNAPIMKMVYEEKMDAPQMGSESAALALSDKHTHTHTNHTKMYLKINHIDIIRDNHTDFFLFCFCFCSIHFINFFLFKDT